jgi:hypothetical protein
VSDEAFASAVEAMRGVWLVRGVTGQNVNSRKLNISRLVIVVPAFALWWTVGPVAGAIYLFAAILLVGVPVAIWEDRRMRLLADQRSGEHPDHDTASKDEPRD